MGLDDKMKNKSQDMKGTAKEHLGRATDNEDLEAEGVLDQTKAGFKQSGEHVKDAARDAADAARGR
jgi:uncharacterized protein YjbJ (UPF0337 family)